MYCIKWHNYYLFVFVSHQASSVLLFAYHKYCEYRCDSKSPPAVIEPHFIGLFEAHLESNQCAAAVSACAISRTFVARYFRQFAVYVFMFHSIVQCHFDPLINRMSFTCFSTFWHFCLTLSCVTPSIGVRLLCSRRRTHKNACTINFDSVIRMGGLYLCYVFSSSSPGPTMRHTLFKYVGREQPSHPVPGTSPAETI